ncbi:MAG TPA: hypothetical protein VGO21_02115, partial [Candidatus Paceibacterota bacterium]|nr:hypothetical protein [Candidatus Paceibacterota bacterium]
MKLKRLLIFLVRSVFVIIVFIFLTNIFIYYKAKPYIYKNVADVPKTQAVLIPGAAVLLNGGISPIFKDRVDKAIELYNAKKVSS